MFMDWIDEGCNRRFKYFFENQHEYDSRLKVGMPVDVKFREVNGIKYMRGVIPRKEYDYKCYVNEWANEKQYI